MQYHISYLDRMAGDVPTRILPARMDSWYTDYFVVTKINGFFNQFSLIQIADLRNRRIELAKRTRVAARKAVDAEYNTVRKEIIEVFEDVKEDLVAQLDFKIGDAYTNSISGELGKINWISLVCEQIEDYFDEPEKLINIQMLINDDDRTRDVRLDKFLKVWRPTTERDVPMKAPTNQGMRGLAIRHGLLTKGRWDFGKDLVDVDCPKYRSQGTYRIYSHIKDAAEVLQKLTSAMDQENWRYRIEEPVGHHVFARVTVLSVPLKKGAKK